ncbi:MAG: preprotein translocase subunit SecY [Elusimicrobia bacterium]|nr:preprotein translocase subunit SecY [Elusimicrobiota bacterium]
MIQSAFDLFKIKDLRKRILITLGVLAFYRLGVIIPVPGVNAEALSFLFKQQANGLIDFINVFSGGAFARMSIFSMGIMPYINASIIMSLLQGAHVIPYLDHLAKEGQAGQKRLNQITRYATVILALIQSFGLTQLIVRIPLPGDVPVVQNPGLGFTLTTMITLVTGTVFVMWLGEQITEFGVGNGTSLIIFLGIIESLPRSVTNVAREVFELQQRTLFGAALLFALVLAVTGLVVWLETGQRNIPVQYAKRVVGRKMMGGQSTYLPLKVDQSGVIAVIFAVSLLSFPVTIASFSPQSPWSRNVMDVFNRSTWWYNTIYTALIIFFCYFYNSVSFNPKDIAENLKKWGGFVLGIRPGEQTAIYLERVMERITLGGSVAVAALCVLPTIMQQKFNAPFFFGGTSILIVVGVALDTISQLESHLIMRHYEGFTKTGKVSGRGRWYAA